jgi:putative membrane protein
VPLAILAAAVLVSLLAIGGYLVTNWGFTLTRAPGAWHLRRGLLTTRETTLDEERLRGVTVAEPLGLRLARGARASAIVTGLGRGQRGSASLVPAAPRAVVVRAAGEVLGSDTALRAPLVPHGPRARARRWTRALGPAALLVVLALVAVALGAPWWVTLLALVGLPVAAALAADRSRALGHRLAGGYLVVRAGSLDRRTEAVEVDGVIGWNLRATWFQRRAGLTTLVATTAGGRQAVTAVDVPDRTALAVAREAHPHLLDQFLAPVSPERRPGAPGRGDL